MIEELYRRIFLLENVTPTTTGGGTSAGSSTTIIQAPDTVSVDQIDGFVGELTSFMAPQKVGGGISGLTAGRVPFAASPERLVDDADLTFATDTLTATKIVVPTSVAVGLLTNQLGDIYAAFNTGTRIVIDSAGTTAFSKIVMRAATGTQAVRTDVADQDQIGSFEFQGYSGGYFTGPSISAKIDGTVTSGQAPPSAWQITTNAANAAPIVRMVVAATGYVGIHIDPPQIFLHVNGSASGTLPANSGTVATGTVRIMEAGSVCMDFGASPNSPFPGWIQVHEKSNQAINYALALQPNGGGVGIGLFAPTASLHLPAGTAAASTAPLKFTSGTVLTTPEAGTIEYDGTDFYLTP